jgi:putative transposase
MLSVAQQCALLDLPRSSFYYQPAAVSEEDLQLMRWLDEQCTATPFYGSRRIQVALTKRAAYPVNRKHVQRLMRTMGLRAVGPTPHLRVPHPGHRVYPYLLRDVPITRVDQVLSHSVGRTHLTLRSAIHRFLTGPIREELSEGLRNYVSANNNSRASASC